MIPFIRSLAELMIITESRDPRNETWIDENCAKVTEDSGQRKRYLKSNAEKKLQLPNIQTGKRREWSKGKKAISKFFDELDYNNQIQPSYDLTLLGRQDQQDRQDAA